MSRGKLNDLVGNEYGWLVVIRRDGTDRHRAAMWICRCVCGATLRVRASHLRSGAIKSCGCRKRTSDGKSLEPEYAVWQTMIRRCTNEEAQNYCHYGGRGIGVCKRWLVYENFIEDMGNRPDETYSIERINNNGDYCPNNCKWANRKTQLRNTRRTVYVQYNGVKKCLGEWCELLHLNYNKIYYRVRVLGNSPELEFADKRNKY